MSGRLTLDEVRHVAKLARLRLTDDQLQQYRSQLSTVLDHIAKLNELDVEGVEPMAHPGDLANRLDDDAVGEALDVEQVLALAPAIEAHYLAVPKVLTDETSS
jgi:aspartyl-tRNA(Asn)/glutamyl-tRNA(Gln) amidotransferase subunit C